MIETSGYLLPVGRGREDRMGGNKQEQGGQVPVNGLSARLCKVHKCSKYSFVSL